MNFELYQNVAQLKVLPYKNTESRRQGHNKDQLWSKFTSQVDVTVIRRTAVISVQLTICQARKIAPKIGMRSKLFRRHLLVLVLVARPQHGTSLIIELLMLQGTRNTTRGCITTLHMGDTCAIIANCFKCCLEMVTQNGETFGLKVKPLNKCRPWSVIVSFYRLLVGWVLKCWKLDIFSFCWGLEEVTQ